jgi:F-type H+-transporting ATPase subunit b
MDALIDYGSLIIQAINFAIVALVLKKFFFVPYMKYLDEEAHKRKELESKLSESTSLVEKAQSDADDILDKAKIDAKMIATEIVENAHRESAEIVAHAQKDADAARSKGFSDIALERKELYKEMKTRVLDLALKLNAKLFSDPKAHKEFIEKNTQNIEL